MNDELLNFIREHGITINRIEKYLNLSRGGLKIRDGKLPTKHLLSVRLFLKSEYGFGSTIAERVEIKEDNPNKPEKTQRYNLKRGYVFDDGKPRYKDELGLWRVVDVTSVVCEQHEYEGYDEFIKREKNLTSNNPIDGELKRDWQGEYLILNNGIHAYINS